MISTTRKFLSPSAAFLCCLAISACGGGGGSSDSHTGRQATGCANTEGPINQQALLTENCEKLSEYRLFANNQNPTDNPNGTGIPYDLTSPLFTDYASKYRFVFVPEGTRAAYSAQESFDFPVGTVLTKTFAMPADTAFRGFANETLIETRLLIRREAGWIALPYVWNEEKTDATLQVAGETQQLSTVHNGEQLDLNYQVPDSNQCKQCHQFKEGSSSSRISPIGPKARLLNKSYAYGSGPANQLEYWHAQGALNLTETVTNIETVPVFKDEDVASLATMDDAELTETAKGYLDVNCAHCHRPEGGASNTGLYLEFWRDFASNQQEHGVCKRPIAFGGGALSFDIKPGDSENSILAYRTETVIPGDRMPEIGRDTYHREGVALIEEWINRMTPDNCL